MQTEARGSEGGGARVLRPVFTKWKEDGLLITPEQSARGLVDFLRGDPWLRNGQVVDLRDL
jgi:hypothetical protein